MHGAPDKGGGKPTNALEVARSILLLYLPPAVFRLPSFCPPMPPADSARLRRRLDAIRRRLARATLPRRARRRPARRGGTGADRRGRTAFPARRPPLARGGNADAAPDAHQTLGVPVAVVTLTGLTTRERCRRAHRPARRHARPFPHRAGVLRSRRRRAHAARRPHARRVRPLHRRLPRAPLAAPLRPPRAMAFLAVPLVSLGLLCWHASLGIGRPPRDAALDAAVARRADALQTDRRRAPSARRQNAPPRSRQGRRRDETQRRTAEGSRQRRRRQEKLKYRTQGTCPPSKRCSTR